jgi:hypothetical protein
MHRNGPWEKKLMSPAGPLPSTLLIPPGTSGENTLCSPPHLSLEEQAKDLNAKLMKLQDYMKKYDFRVGNVESMGIYVTYGPSSVYIGRSDIFSLGLGISYSEYRPFVEGLQKALECN